MQYYSEQNIKQLKKSISDISWSKRNQFPKGYKFLSTSAVMKTMQEKKDWLAIATKCGKNPEHEHYGKTGEEIQKIWWSKGSKGADRGNILDDYITAKLAKKDYVIPESADEETLEKIKAFDKFAEKKLGKLQYVGSEIWLNSGHGILCRLDALFVYIHDGKATLLVVDWKNTNNIRTENHFQQLKGPLAAYDDCEMVTYSFQVLVYWYILACEYGLNLSGVRIVQILKDTVKVHEPVIPYDKELVIAAFDWAKSR